MSTTVNQSNSSSDAPLVQVGDTLVTDDGSVTVTIDGVDGDTFDVTDSRTYHDSGEYDRTDVLDAVRDGHFRVVRDSDLTAIKGVGEATAPELEAKTDCTTPDELARAFLHDDDGGIYDAIPRTDYFIEWLRENVHSLDVDVSLAQLKVMLFIMECNCNPRISSVTDVSDIGSRKHGTVDEAKVTVDHLEWGENAYWTDSATVAMVGRGDPIVDLHDGDFPTDEYVTCESDERDGTYHVFRENGNETWVSNDYLDRLQEIFVFDTADVKVHPDGEYPVTVDDEETSLTLSIAPRIRQ